VTFEQKLRVVKGSNRVKIKSVPTKQKELERERKQRNTVKEEHPKPVNIEL
jgi:hypothetical protein